MGNLSPQEKIWVRPSVLGVYHFVGLSNRGFMSLSRSAAFSTWQRSVEIFKLNGKKAQHGTARHGTAWRGTARHGTAGHSTARHGNFEI